MPGADRPGPAPVGEEGPEPSGGPDRFIVRFSGPNGAPVGVGVLVGESEILTCAHVVNAALGLDPRTQAEPTDPITVDFPLLPSPRAARWP